MIRVRLLTEPEYRNLWQTEPGYQEYDESQFYDLLREFAQILRRGRDRGLHSAENEQKVL